MSALVDLLLGVVTSIGGFVEAGSISTAAQGGARFRFELLWAIAVAGAMIAMLIEMSGRVAAVSGQTVAGAIRERFGIHFQIVPLCAELLLDTLLLAAELGGVATALKLVAGSSFVVWIVPFALLVGVIFWTAGFAVIEDGVGLLGLVTLSFVFAAWKLHPTSHDIGRGLIPSLPDHDWVGYSALAVSIVGATVSPYLLNFYSAGTVEEGLEEKQLWVNRTTAFMGMGFGSIVSMGVLVCAAVTLAPAGVQADTYEEMAAMFTPVFGDWGTTLFALSLGIGCFGAAVEISLNGGYLLAQVFGWQWGANERRRDAARFALAASGILLAGTLLALTGIDPLKLTEISMALTVLVMPLVILPFLVLMNDRRYVGDHTSGMVGNLFLAALTIAAALLALVVIPLQLFGG
jgi:Mn2+/Fe2+ NRAMP family transporter